MREVGWAGRTYFNSSREKRESHAASLPFPFLRRVQNASLYPPPHPTPPHLLTTHARKTLDFVRTVEDAGVDFITVHGRRRRQRSSEPVDLDAIRIVKEHARVPVVANGDAWDLDAVRRIAEVTGADGELILCLCLSCLQGGKGISRSLLLFLSLAPVPTEGPASSHRLYQPSSPNPPETLPSQPPSPFLCSLSQPLLS